MAHHHHRHVAAEQPSHFLGAVAGGVDDGFAADLALGRGQHPFALVATGGGHRAEADDFLAHVARALGERLGELRRIDVAVVGVVERALEVVRLDEGVAAT